DNHKKIINYGDVFGIGITEAKFFGMFTKYDDHGMNHFSIKSSTKSNYMRFNKDLECYNISKHDCDIPKDSDYSNCPTDGNFGLIVLGALQEELKEK
ncbi:MAG: hypothetical protein K0T99_01250, partial [Alphaproteobacteria bacterium]|nr:hypothetical protein [Alphaproteobacteria bacterium]